MSDASHGDHGSHRSKTFYVVIGVILAIVTLVELGPLFEWYNLPVLLLLTLSLAKFAAVVAFFMHLWDDEKVYTQVFVVPLIGALAMVGVLMLLFSAYYPSPRDDSFAIQQRYFGIYNGECTSWLTSHVSNREYCASPPLDHARLVMHLPGGGSMDEEAYEDIDISEMGDEEKLSTLLARGEEIYISNCTACHQADGEGIPGVYPPLKNSDYYGDAETHARIIVHGLTGEIVVNGQTYNNNMNSFKQFSDFNIAAVATYERNSWGNEDGVVLPEDVEAVR